MIKTILATVLFIAVTWTVPAAASPYVYVADHNAGTVTVLDASTNTIVRTIPNLPDAYGIAVNPLGTRVYVTGGVSGTVSILDPSLIGNSNQNPIINQFIGFGNAIALSLDSEGRWLYVADGGTNQVTGIYLPNDAIQPTFAAEGSGISNVSVDPTRRLLAVANGSGSSGTVRIFNLEAGTHTDVSLQAMPEALAFNSDGMRLWIGTQSGLVAYNVMTGKQTSMTVPGGVRAIAHSPRSGDIYIASLGNPDVYVYPAMGAAPTAIGLSGDPRGLALSPDGTRAYATLSGGVAVIDTATMQVVATPSLSGNYAVSGNFVGPGDIVANNQVKTATVGEQVTGTASAVDAQSRTLTYNLISQPSNGTLNFDSSTGAYTYTPSPGSSGVASFVWEATASGGTGSPTEPRSRPVTTAILIRPGLSTFNDQHVDSGATIGPLDFTLQGSTPITVSVSSTQDKVIDPASAKFNSGCGTSTLNCTLTLTAGLPKGRSALVTVSATDPSGVTTQQIFKVTINGTASSGGGGMPWPILAGLAALLIATTLRRRIYENRRV